MSKFAHTFKALEDLALAVGAVSNAITARDFVAVNPEIKFNLGGGTVSGPDFNDHQTIADAIATTGVINEALQDVEMIVDANANTKAQKVFLALQSLNSALREELASAL